MKSPLNFTGSGLFGRRVDAGEDAECEGGGGEEEDDAHLDQEVARPLAKATRVRGIITVSVDNIYKRNDERPKCSEV